MKQAISSEHVYDGDAREAERSTASKKPVRGLQTRMSATRALSMKLRYRRFQP